MSPQELLGLKAIVLYLHQLPIQRKNVPALIYDPVELLRSIKKIVEKHRYDSPAKAVTGRPILIWPGERAEVWLYTISRNKSECGFVIVYSKANSFYNLTINTNII